MNRARGQPKNSYTSRDCPLQIYGLGVADYFGVKLANLVEIPRMHACLGKFQRTKPLRMVFDSCLVV